ncbi:MAG: hypothetical protein AAF700_10160 [Pseudomonadota bacterium]
MGSQSDVEARQIANDMLEFTGTTMLAGEFDRFASAFKFPHVVTTMEKTIRIETPQDMKRLFDNLRDTYDRIGLTHMVRECVAAHFRTPERLEVTHVSQMMAGTRRLEEPFPVFSILEKINGSWLISSSDYAIHKMQPVGATMELGQKSEPLKIKHHAED